MGKWSPKYVEALNPNKSERKSESESESESEVYQVGCVYYVTMMHGQQNIKYSVKGKVKFSRYRPKWPRGWIEVYLYPFLTSALEGGGCSVPRPGRFTPGKDPVPTVQEAEWARPHGRSGPVRKISPPLGFFYTTFIQQYWQANYM
jgi:hypothetical protein